MAEWIVLGSAHAVPDAQHANTHFALTDGERTLLVDAPCEVVSRLRQAGISPWHLDEIILTHFHPDHTAGMPMLLMDSWLQGRTAPLHIYALEDVIDRLQRLMSLYRWENWPDFFPVVFHAIPTEAMTPVLEAPAWRVWASPVEHMVPAIGLRIAFPNGEVLAYSGDTGPCEAVVGLARHADYLFHEATGAMGGHTSAAQAGDTAARAGAKRLYLVHTATDPATRTALATEASKVFDGEVVVADDLLRVSVGA